MENLIASAILYVVLVLIAFCKNKPQSQTKVAEFVYEPSISDLMFEARRLKIKEELWRYAPKAELAELVVFAKKFKA